jgi:hypothetical protein
MAEMQIDNTTINMNILSDSIVPITESIDNSSEITFIYHPLSTSWNLWAHLPHDIDWSVKSYQSVFKFSTVENTIAITETLPDILIKNCMLFIMKEEILPMWEDPRNREGGCFSYKISNKNVCEVWKELTYVLLGGTISTNPQFGNNVTGITISPKKNFCIIKIWMTNCQFQNPTVVTADVKGLMSNGCLFKKHTPEY